MVFVGGKPVKMFKNMEDLARPEHQKFALLLHQVHFLPLTNARFYEEYEPAEISPRDYSFVKSTLPTIAVESVLVSYEGQAVKAKKSKKKPTNPRCDTLHKFASALRASLPTLKEKGHPKWREVTLSDDVVGWKKDSCLR